MTHAITAVRAFPSSEDCRMRVSLESRYETWLFSDFDASDEITRDRTDKERLIFRASSNVSPVALVKRTDSEPAKSTRESCPTSTPPGSLASERASSRNRLSQTILNMV